ncbi:hypothetical protein AMECASPLE_038239 [Ameca splendens]|uniref:Uncharacterized protein n=1 Tax=Ameca splendens TaxID=208324 RepID=A0ABV0Z6D0_9TELE
MFFILRRVPLCTMNSKGFRGVTGSDAATPADDGIRDFILHQRYIEDMQHLAANNKGLELSQEVQSALYLFVDSFTDASPSQPVVQVNTEIFILLHDLHFFSHDGYNV